MICDRTSLGGQRLPPGVSPPVIAQGPETTEFARSHFVTIEPASQPIRIQIRDTQITEMQRWLDRERDLQMQPRTKFSLLALLSATEDNTGNPATPRRKIFDWD